MRAPSLTDTVVTSIEALLGDLPAGYIGTDKEDAIRYLTKLVEHHWSPTAVQRRAAAVVFTQKHRSGK